MCSECCVSCFPAEDAEAWKARGEAVILCRQETSPEDVGGMHAAEGILTSRGGMTSHAAVVARGWGKPCCCGCEELIVDSFAKTLKAPVSMMPLFLCLLCTGSFAPTVELMFL